MRTALFSFILALIGFYVMFFFLAMCVFYMKLLFLILMAFVRLFFVKNNLSEAFQMRFIVNYSMASNCEDGAQNIN